GQHSDYVTTNTAIKPNLIPKHALKKLIQDKSPLTRADGKTVYLSDSRDGRDNYLTIDTKN
ncbi:hypothetical protein, partial [Spirosoma pomorum]